MEFNIDDWVNLSSTPSPATILDQVPANNNPVMALALNRSRSNSIQEITMQQGGNLKLRQHYEGQLNKYTNVMKGWQYRWFVLNPDKGTLEYHVSEGEMKIAGNNNRPRGALHLAGAVISPSEEDSHTFMVNSASGELYKLRAVDAKERQEWITRLRMVSELHSQALSQTNSPLVSRDHGSSTARVVPCNLNVLDAFAQVQEWLQRAESSCYEMGNQMDQFPTSGPGPAHSTDQDLLALRATALTSLGCLQECLYSLQLQQRTSGSSDGFSTNIGGIGTFNLLPQTHHHSTFSTPTTAAPSMSIGPSHPPRSVTPDVSVTSVPFSSGGSTSGSASSAQSQYVSSPASANRSF